MGYARVKLRKWFVEAILHIALISAGLASAPWLARELEPWWPEVPHWPLLSQLAPWIAVSVLTWPLMLTLAGKVTATAIFWAETSIAVEDMGSQTQKARQRAAARRIQQWLTILALWALILLILVQPPWFAYALLLPSVIASAQRSWTSFFGFYAICNRTAD